jgi:hypothetical protein
MASPSPQAGVNVTIDVPGLDEVRERFKQLPKALAARHMAAGLRRAVEKGGTLQALRTNTPRGPTGNLRRAIAVKSKTYIRGGYGGVGIAIVGYKAGRKFNDPFDDNTLAGYHQGLLEFGTKERFRRTANRLRVSTGKMPVGGSYKRPPIRTAWEQTRGRVEALMVREMSDAVEAAGRDLAGQVRASQRAG